MAGCRPTRRALVGAVVVAIAFVVTGRRRVPAAASILGCLVIAVVVFSRVELGVHWSTDVLAGSPLTLGWCRCGWLPSSGSSPRRRPPPPDRERRAKDPAAHRLCRRSACDSAVVPVLVHLSDIHFGAHRAELAESLLADVASVGPDLVVLSGDLTQRARPGQFEQARAFIDRLPATVLTVVGNHDLPLVNLPRRFLSGTRRYERYVTGDLDPVVAIEGLVAVGLDTMPAWRWKAGHVSPRQAALVRDVLGSAPPGAWRLVVTHHPVLPARLSGLVGRDLLVGACADSGVALLLAGHTHTPSADVVDLDAPSVHRQALALVAGTAISSRTRGSANTYEVVRLDGPMRAGALIAVEIREPTSTGWSGRRGSNFVYTSDGVVAERAAS